MKHQVCALLLFVGFGLCANVDIYSKFDPFFLSRLRCDKEGVVSEGNDLIVVDYEETEFAVGDEILKYIQKYGVEERDNDGNTVLHAAALYGDVGVIERLLREGADIEARNNSGLTPLHLAAIQDNEDNVKILIRNGADLNAEARDGRTSLMSVASHGYSRGWVGGSCAEVLIRCGADIHRKNKYGFTALHFSVIENNFDQDYKLLIKNGADVNACSHDGITPLHLAVYSENILAIEFLVEHGADSSIRDVYGNKPAQFMCHYYDYNLSATLSKYEKVRGRNKEQPVVFSVELALLIAQQIWGSTSIAIFPWFDQEKEILEYIRKFGLRECSSDGNTALHFAARRYSVFRHETETVKIILREGADVEAKNNQGLTPLHFLVVYGRSYDSECKRSCIELLLKSGANINTQTDDGKTPLMSVVLSDSCSKNGLSEFLISHAANVNCKNRYGFTALHCATVLNNCSRDIVKLLIESGADVNVQSNYGITPLHLAAYADDSSMVEFLLENGADPSLSDVYGNKPVHYMCQRYNHEVFTALSGYNDMSHQDRDEWWIVSDLEMQFLLAKQLRGAAFYSIFPDMEELN